MSPPSAYAPVVAPHDRISRKDAAARLGVSLLTIDRYADAGRLTREKNEITKRVWFSRREVEKLRTEREGEK